MRVVVDSGSTKADWAFLSDGANQIINTIGFNPVFDDSARISSELKLALPSKYLQADVEQISYFGAGCWDERRNQVVHRALHSLWPSAKIEVEHDLLGAAKATCGREAGISCILGTGSNSCLFDGNKVIDNVTNLGFMLGDEGSGTHLGKKLIRAYFYREMPTNLQQKFAESISGGKSEILDKVYEGKTPNVYLATFARFLSEHRDHPYCKMILERSFTEFVDRHVCKYDRHQELPIHFIGSIAYNFKDEMTQVLCARNLTAGLYIQKPIESLAAIYGAN